MIPTFDIEEMFDCEKASRREEDRRKQIIKPVVTGPFDYQAHKQRAADTHVEFREFMKWCVTARAEGLDGIKVELQPLRHGEQKKILRILKTLGDVIYNDIITEEDIDQVAHCNNWRFQRAEQWIERYQTAGIWGLTGRFNPFGSAANETRDSWDEDLVGLTDEENDDIDIKFGYIEPILNKTKTVKERVKELRRQGKGVCAATLFNYMRRFREFKRIGLHRKTRSDKGKPRLISEELQDIIRCLRLSDDYKTDEVVWEKACEIAASRNEPKPSLEKVKAICRKISRAAKYLSDERNDLYTEEVKPTGPIVIPNDYIVIQLDSTKADLLTSDERPDDGNETVKKNKKQKVKTVRLNVIGAYDKNSGQLVAKKYQYDEIDRFDVGGIIYDVLNKMGFVHEIWVDRGKAYISKHVRTALEEIGIKLVELPPHSPQLKGGIERFFRTLRLGLWRTLKGYTGPNTSERPPVIRVELTPSEAEIKLNAFIEKYNNKKKYRTKMTPNAYCTKHYATLPVDREKMALLLQKRETRTVQQEGVRYHGVYYWHEDIFEHDDDLVGKEVRIHVDPYEYSPDTIEIIFNKKWICTASKDSPSHSRLKREQERHREKAKEEIAEAKVKTAPYTANTKSSSVPSAKLKGDASNKSRPEQVRQADKTQDTQKPPKRKRQKRWDDMPDIK